MHLRTESKFVSGISIIYTSLKNIVLVQDVSKTWQSVDFTMVSAFCALRQNYFFRLWLHLSLTNWYSESFIKMFYSSFLRDFSNFYCVSQKYYTLFFETRGLERSKMRFLRQKARRRRRKNRCFGVKIWDFLDIFITIPPLLITIWQQGGE